MLHPDASLTGKAYINDSRSVLFKADLSCGVSGLGSTLPDGGLGGSKISVKLFGSSLKSEGIFKSSLLLVKTPCNS